MKAFFEYLLILALLPVAVAAGASSQASSGFDEQTGGVTELSSGAKFMPPDKVFKLHVASAGPHAVRARWSIAPGYYLYRGRFHFSLASDSKLSLGSPKFPPATVKTDAYFGKSRVYHHAVNVLIPVKGASRGDRVRLNVTYQGCADAGFCYPPIKRTVRVMLVGAAAASATSNAAGAGAARAPADPPVSEQGRLAHLIVTGDLPLVMLVFAGLGLLLAFTPCVLPMLPILSGLIVGQGERMTTGRAFSLSLVYVLAVALTYTAAGVVAGLSGANLQVIFQTPWVIALFSLFFIALALSMFGVYELQMPAALQSRATELSNRQRGGTFVGAGVMGVLSALIVGPCLAAPLAGALLVISRGGDPLRGGLVLFALSIGMGLPLLAVGTSAGGLVPRAGPWMDAIKRTFGVLLLGVAIWFLSRILPGALTLGLWGLLAVIVAASFGTFRPVRLESAGFRTLSQSVGVVALIYGVAMVIGAAAGGSDPGQPLAPFTRGAATEAAPALAFQHIKSVRDLRRAVTAATHRNRPVMLDFYADWCVSCKEMEHSTFQAPQVHRALQNLVLLRADVTANDVKDKALLKHFGIFGPPSIMFFNRKGEENKQDRVVGYMAAADFLTHIPEASPSRPMPVKGNG